MEQENKLDYGKMSKQYNVAIGKLGCRHCGVTKCGTFHDNKCEVCGNDLISHKLDDIIAEIAEINIIQNSTITEKVLKFNEEFGEFSAEVVKLLGLTQKEYSKEHLVEEMADALQCQLSIYLDVCHKAGFSIDEVFDAIPEKNKKWRSVICNYGRNNNLK